MIFGIDIRRRICKPNSKWMDYIDLKTRLNLLRSDDDETNPEILHKLDMAYNIMEEIEALKKSELRDVINQFEKDFVKEVKENKFLYGDE